MTQSIHFQKIPGDPNINIFCENWLEASFYIKEQAQKTNSKFEFKKLLFMTPKIACFLFLKKKPLQKFFLCVVALTLIGIGGKPPTFVQNDFTPDERRGRQVQPTTEVDRYRQQQRLTDIMK